MGSLSKEDKDIILDFYFRCGDEETINRGRDLVASNPEAAILYARLEETLTQLDSIKYEPCPDNLVELTVARLKLAASSGQTQLAALLELERQKGEGLGEFETEPTETEDEDAAVLTSSKWAFSENFFKLSSLAAVILITAGIAWPTLRNVRQAAWRITCSRHLNTLGAGLVRYAADNEDAIPYAAGTGGSQWARIGEQGSITSSPFLLLKGNYADAEDFICPGHSGATAMKCGTEELARLQDFASRANFSYSFRVLCENSDRRLSVVRGPILVDMSPVFQPLCTKSSAGPIELNEDLLNCCSNNHGCRGQNVLFTDGSVKFMKVRLLGDDDIFTIRDVKIYFGNESPRDPQDIFLP
ncbi:MAG TPA: hypothetical protein P5279_08055 [Anaerohalosphaeraceae bacterium]|jgi:hypothetical protein|nr:hypothetical protein [Anaerohalosphaeraceae bacterium]HRT50429.1 hypothetical protein [Anaerohalosphaeraceae bacterium]HRT86359.1 hypothetical protein [Anaerohalosphaeraceae bacterium]